MNLAFVVSKYFPFGGMQRTLLRIACACRDRGHSVDIISGSWEGAKEQGINSIVIHTNSRTNHGKVLKLASHISKITKEKNYHCVVGFTKIPNLNIYYAGDPCLASKTSVEKPKIYARLPRYKTYLDLESKVFGRGRKTEIILIAHKEKQKFIHHYGTEEERFHLLPPGINRNQFVDQALSIEAREAVRSSFNLGNHSYLILLVGSSFKTKGVGRAIRALSSLPPEIKERCKLLVVGQGKPSSFLRLAKKTGVLRNVEFTGPRKDIAKLYYSADLLVHPALSENTGTTLIEAMLCGLPVLTTENCGFAHHIKQANAGLICPVPFDQEVLNKQLYEMLTSAKRSDWKQNGPTYCQKTDLYSLIEKASDLIIAKAQMKNHAL